MSGFFDDSYFTFAVFQKNRPKFYSPDFETHIRDGVIHLADLMRYLLGEGKVLDSSYRLDDNGAIAESSATIQLDKGGIAILAASLNSGNWIEKGELHGGAATIYFDQFRGMDLIQKGEKHEWKQPYDASWETNMVGRGIVGELQHFFQCLESRQQPLTNAWDSLKTQELVEEIISKAVRI